MPFSLIIDTGGSRKFKKIPYLNGDSCIKGTPNDFEVTENEENILVIYPDDKQVTPYPSIEPGKVLYPVKVGDDITVCKKEDGIFYSKIYSVMSITDTDVICGPFV